MCGIFGLLDFGGVPFDARTAEELLPLVGHRGPDGRGTFAAPGILLGHTRLAFLDLSEAGAQPMSTADGRYTIVFNGEIYNHLEIRSRLAGRISFRGRSDTETLLEAYAAWGPRCLDDVRGMFAFAVYDRTKRSLFLARDRVGKKPLVFWHDAARGRLAFASELRVLTALGAPNDLDHESVALFLRLGYIPAPRTVFGAASKLRAGHYLETDGMRVAERRYHRLTYHPKREVDAESCRSEIRELLTSATKRRLLSDRPLGVLLSGGVDSTAVTATMARLSREPVRTFSMGFASWPQSELPYAEEVARRFGTDHHSFTISHTSLEALLPTLAWHYGEPFGDPSAIPTYCLAQLVRRHVVGALVGDGGDENFMGYRRYWLSRSRRVALRIPQPLRNAITRRVEETHGWQWRRARLVAEGFRGSLVDLFLARTGRLRGFGLESLLAPDLAASLNHRDPRSDIVRELWSDLDGPETAEKMMAVDAQLYLPDQLLVKMDIASMAHGLEIRAPFLDADLMASVATMPEDLKLAGSHYKAILIDSITEVPASFFARRKQGFSPPVEQWLTGAARTYLREVLLDPSTDRRGLWNPSMLRQLIDHMDQFPDLAHDMYLLLFFEVWARTCLDTSYQSAPRCEFDWSEQHHEPAASRPSDHSAMKSSSLNM